MYFTDEKIKKNASMVRIRFDEPTTKQMISDMENIINWIGTLDKIDTSNIDPMISTLASPLPKRTDTINLQTTREEILKNAPSPDSENEYFTVPKIIE